MTETPVLRQYREVKDRHPDALVLFRLGDFFELFFEDAVAAAPILGVTLTSRPLGKGGRAPMCGVPHHAWQSYAGKLLRAGRRVVVCDQVPGDGKGLARREVTRVLTPGTVLEDAYLEPSASNHLVAAWTHGAEAGLAACDISTGELLLCQLPAHLVPGEIERWRPAELLTPPEVEAYRFDPERGAHRLREVLRVQFAAAVGAAEAPLAVGAAGVVLEYLQGNRVHLEPGVLRVRTYRPEATMYLDAATRRNLELPRLVALVDRTVTPMGARRLRAWMEAPLRDVETIELRLAAVDELSRAPRIREAWRKALQPLGDLERLTSRAAQSLAQPRDLAALRGSLRCLPDLQRMARDAESVALRQLGTRIAAEDELATLLERALVDEPPARDVGAIRAGFDTELDRIRSASSGSREWIAALEARERERTGIRSLRVGFNRVFGYYIEVSAANAGSVPADYVRRQTVQGGERYLTPELKEHEATVLNAERDFSAREDEVLRELQRRVAAHAEALLETGRAIGEIDGLLSFAETASRLGWTRPVVEAGAVLELRAARHPLVEASLPAGSFVPNDLDLDRDRTRTLILTGPNMAGKSTYLRQTALVVLLAQCGSFVPADSARIGIADRIFTRVGAQDDLAGGASTFMVEMTETANILNHATTASVLIVDEVGRGTSTYDGLSIAQAVVEHIHERIGSRTLFATHFHELTSLAERLPGVANHRMEVVEEDGEVHFLHHVVAGGADRSYGIHVAALAGLPATVIRRARNVLNELEAHRPLEPPGQQLALALETPDAVREELEELDVDRLTPLEALQKLSELRARLATR